MSRAEVSRFLSRLDEQRRDEVENDVGSLRGLTLEERGRIVESVCRDAMAILRARPDFEQAVLQRDLRSPESERTWLQAVKRFRDHGRHRVGKWDELIRGVPGR
jgi:hypothetical protein